MRLNCLPLKILISGCHAASERVYVIMCRGEENIEARIKVKRPLSPCCVRRGQNCSCVGSAGLSGREKTALVKAVLVTECTPHVNRRI